jgi:hypothetical protein
VDLIFCGCFAKIKDWQDDVNIFLFGNRGHLRSSLNLIEVPIPALLPVRYMFAPSSMLWRSVDRRVGRQLPFIPIVDLLLPSSSIWKRNSDL